MARDTELVGQAIYITRVVSEAIRAAGEIPSGHLYAMMMNVVDIDEYEKIISVLVNVGLVENKNHLLKWRGGDKI